MLRSRISICMIIVSSLFCFCSCSEMAADQKGDLLNIEGNALDSKIAKANTYFDVSFAVLYPTTPKSGKPDLYVVIESHGTEGLLSRKGLFILEFDSNLDEQVDHAITLKRRGGDFLITHRDLATSSEYEISDDNIYALPRNNDKGIGITIDPEFLASINIDLANFNWRVSTEFIHDEHTYIDHLPDSKNGTDQWKTLSMKTLSNDLFAKSEYADFSATDPRYDLKELDKRSLCKADIQSSYAVYDIISVSILREAREVVINLFVAAHRGYARTKDGSGFFIEFDGDFDNEPDVMISINKIDGKYITSAFNLIDKTNVVLPYPAASFLSGGVDKKYRFKIANLILNDWYNINPDRFQWRISSEFITGQKTYCDQAPDNSIDNKTWYKCTS